MKFHAANLIPLTLLFFLSSYAFQLNLKQVSATCVSCSGNESQGEIRIKENQERGFALTHDIWGRPYSSSESSNNFFPTVIILILITSPVAMYMLFRANRKKDE